MANHKRLTKRKLSAIIIALVCIAVYVSLIITNIFIPVKYLFSYFVSSDGRAEEGVMRVRFVDVGYGDCVIVELPDGKNMIIDAGDGRYSHNSEILKYLNMSGISAIDYLVCTSVNTEHCGGLEEILRYKTVKKVYMPYCTNTYITDAYGKFSAAVKSSGAETAISEYGAREVGERYFFMFLSPTAYDNSEGEYAYLNENPESVAAKNNASAVIWLEYAGTAFMFASDAPTEALEKIVNSYLFAEKDFPVNLRNCAVVQVANHGGANSACAELYDCLSPSVAVISVGDNGMGSPSVSVLSDVINSVGDGLYITTETGTVTIEVTAEGYAVV